MFDPKAMLEFMRRAGRSAGRINMGLSTLTQIVPYSEDRIALVLFPAASTYFISFSPDAANNFGIMIATSNGPLNLTVWEHGQAVFGPVWGFCSSGAVNTGYLETFAPP